MPINIPNDLPAAKTLSDENIFIMFESRAEHQDIRPLNIAILNLMPTKIETETQLLRLLGNSPLQVTIDLIHMSTHKSKNTSQEHLLKFYKTFEDIKDNHYDGLIITGAPVETMEFEKVNYWEELCSIMEWSKRNVYSTLHICWGAQAGLHYHYGINKYLLPQKMFGVFKHNILSYNHPLLRGFDDIFLAPHSRHTEIKAEDILSTDGLELLSTSKEAGVYIVSSTNGRQFFVTGHSEYELGTLSREYFRDVDKGLDINVPCNYFIDNDPKNPPYHSWRSHANLIFSNWLNYFVYQDTPFDLDNMPAL